MFAGLCYFLKVLGKNPYPCLFQLLKTPALIGSLSPTSIFKASRNGLGFSHIAPLQPPLCFPLLFLGTLQIKLGLSIKLRIISPSQGHLISKFNSICNLNSPLPWKVTYLQVSGIKTWASWNHFNTSTMGPNAS